MAHVLFTGIQELGAAFAAISARQVRFTGVATGKALHLVERETKKNLNRTTHKRGEPTASMPGDPPALVSGDLRRSVQVEGPAPTGPISWEGWVGPTIKYGRIQELGGDTGRSTLPARPYVSPTLADCMPEIATIYREAWAAALKG